jgi:hypothetical protein
MRLGLLARDKIKDGHATGEELLKAAKKRWPRSTDWPELGVRKPKRHS